MAALISPLVAWLADLVDDQISALRSDRYPADLGPTPYPLINADRTSEVRYVGHDLRPFAGACRRIVLSLEVRIAYRYAVEPTTVGADDGEASTSTARLRCADDAALIREACLNASLYGTVSNGAVVEMMTPGPHTIDDPGDGSLIGVLPVELIASYSPSTVTAGAALG